MNKSLFVFVAAIILFAAGPSYAFQPFLGKWQEKYPDSNTDDAGCQLCHVKPNGGEPWNAYGIQVRNVLAALDVLGGGASDEDLDEAFEFAVGGNSGNENFDNDPNGENSLTEINNNTQPGWTEGDNNSFHCKDDSTEILCEGAQTVFNKPPPSSLPCGVVLDNGSEPFCSVSNPLPSSIPRGDIVINLETVASEFTAPVLAVSAPNDNESIYVVEQGGKIQRVNLETGTKELFLDLSAELVSDFGQIFGGFDERGLLGLAFHPNYGTNNKIYTYISKDYVDGAETLPSTMPDGVDPNHQAVISEWEVDLSQPNLPSATETELLIIDQPQFNHNGGTVGFGPDGYLYISLGDGGCRNDENDSNCSSPAGHGEDGNGRDNTNPLGTILRIDVDAGAPANGRYDIPATNPFVGIAGLDEIYAFGLRNPYRFSFEDLDSNEFNLYIGDVGQGALEEVDLLHSSAGSTERNFGWNYKEGTLFFDFDSNGNRFLSNMPPLDVVIPPLVDPIAEYDHDEGVSVIGGHVYEGVEIEALQGKYVFGEWSRSFSSPRGRLFYLNDTDEMREFRYQSAPNMFITGFGQDSQNELYVVGSKSSGVNGSTGVLKKITLGVDDELCVPVKATNGNISVICL